MEIRPLWPHIHYARVPQTQQEDITNNLYAQNHASIWNFSCIMARDYANKFTGIMLIQFHFRYETRIDGEWEHDRRSDIRKRHS